MNATVRLRIAPPFTAVTPADLPPTGGVLVNSSRRLRFPYVSLVQGGRVIAARRFFRTVSPDRPLRLSARFLMAVDRRGGDLLVGLMDSSYIPFDIGEHGPYLPMTGP